MIPMTPGDPTAANQELVLAGGDGRRWLACDVFFGEIVWKQMDIPSGKLT